MRVDPRGRVREIASASDEAKRVLESCGVDFCCKGDSTLRDACAGAGVSLHDVERRLSELPDAPPPPSPDVAELVDHVLGTCHHRTREAVEKARALVRAGRAARGFDLLGHALDDFATHADAQLTQEESLFRRVRALADARVSRGPFPEAPFSAVHAQEKKIRAGHARLHEKLRHLTALAGAPEVDSAPLRRAVDRLADAVLTQMHLVNNELLPRARALEPE